MKRNEVTAKALVEMGYKAMVTYQSWHRRETKECNEKQSRELMELVAETARNGGKVTFVRNDYTYVVNVYVECAANTANANSAFGFEYFISRPMTEKEKFEADVRTRRGIEWDWEK